MQLPDYTNPFWFVILILVFFIIITGRYFILSGIFYLIFHIWFPEKWKSRKIYLKDYKPGQFKTEVKWSMISGILFSIAGAVTIVLWQKGFTKAYGDYNLYGWWYLPVSLVIFLLAHETYYYWLHRWMHKPSVFRLIHKVHHDSKITSPFTAFSFHPIEGFFQAIFLPLMLLVLPMHYAVIFLLLFIMSVSSVINHLNFEIYPKNFNTNFFGKWLVGASHHSLHHQQVKHNFGLYFTFWDKLKNTESPDYNNLFDSTTSKTKAGSI